MIILDTHIWIWWVDDNPKLSLQNQEIIQANQTNGLGISIISIQPNMILGAIIKKILSPTE